MGKVFTWSEIQSKAVPTAEGFRRTLDMLKNDLAHASSVKTAVICGSVVRGDHTLRSDIDCLVIYDAGRSRSSFAVMQELSMKAAKMFVPVTFIACGTDVAATRMHHLGPSFFEHIARSAHAGGVIKGWPVTVLQENRNKDVELEAYVRVKLYSLEEQCAEYPSKDPKERAHTLKKMLEAPVHVARKVLGRQSVLKGDSKAAIVQQYREEMSAELSAHLDALVSLDYEYTEVLGALLEKPDEAQHADFIGYIEEELPNILAFVKKNALHVASMPAP